MSCRPERVTGLVDGALSAAERTEVATHVAACAACAQQVAEERELRAKLRRLPAMLPRPGFDEKIRRRLRARRWRAWRVLVPLAASLAVLFLWGRENARVVAWELARDHASCFGKKMLPAKIHSRSIDEIDAWFARQGTDLPALPASVSGLELVGARYCPLIDRFVAHLYYVDGGRHVSVFIIPGTVRFHADHAATPMRRAVRLFRLDGVTVGVAGDRDADVDAVRHALSTRVASSALSR